MICNKCGTDIPDHAKFCIRCGNRLQPDIPSGTAAVPGSSVSPQAEPPKTTSSGSPFGTKTISDRHYSLEDIARQQAESNNEIGLASAPPRRSGKSKKRRHAPETALPPIGASDSMELNDLSDSRTAISAVSSATAADVPSDNPLLPSLSELQKAPPQQGKPVKHQSTIPQGAVSVNPLLGSLSELTGESTAKSTASVPSTAAVSAHTANTSVPTITETPMPSAATTERSYRYSITTPPVPTGLQRQVVIDLFGGGDIRSQVENLRKEYFARKNAVSPQ